MDVWSKNIFKDIREVTKMAWLSPCNGSTSCKYKFWIRIYRISRISEDVFGLNKMFIYRGLLIIPTFRRCDDASAEGFEMKEASNNYLPTQTDDVIVNPTKSWFKTRWQQVNITLKPVGEKTRGIASLQVIKNPDGMDSQTMLFHCSINRGMCLYNKRTTARFAPT